MVFNQRLAKSRPGFVKILFAGMVVFAVQMSCQAAAREPEPSLVVQLARGLHDSPQPMRSDFAWLALTRMAEFYNEEAARARRETRHTSRAGDASRWAAAVEDYARKMSSLADSITSATDIVINVDITNSVYVYVDGQPVIVTGAIGGQQSVYEQQLMERFCTLYICEELLPELEYSERDIPGAVLDTDESTAYWSFSQYAGPVCMTDDGLEFQFQQMSDLGEKRVACTRAVAELSELARAITRSIKQGVSVDWDALQVLHAPGDEPQWVKLAARVEIRLPLPLLVENPELLGLVRPWLKARVHGGEFHLIVLNAERFLGLEDRPAGTAVKQRYPAFNIVHE
jgi:hypothetical protein